MCVNKREGASEKSDAVPVTAGLQFIKKSMFLFQKIFRLFFFLFFHLIMCVFDAVLHCDHNEVPNFHMS